MSTTTQTLFVPHLGGIDVGYRLSQPAIDRAKPTVVLFNPFTATADYYEPEFQNADLCASANLVAVEPLGHGRTMARSGAGATFTYWDSAHMALQLLDALGVDTFFALGTSQGGWIAVRLALLAPTRVLGVVPVGSSMDAESAESRALGCWDGPAATAGFVAQAGAPTADTAADADFVPGDGYCDFLMEIGFGPTVTPAIRGVWSRSLARNYHGAAGKQRIIMAAVALATRDSLRARLPCVRCPVLWLQGTADAVFSLQQAAADLPLFANAADARLVPCPGGVHFLSHTHKDVLHRELLAFVHNWTRGAWAQL
ncbi:microsomal epoxide hydrolase [Sporothrix schenckii 1099-18]|uniref:AB hydrolase-1 domain-containing protein n=2 Tax=Sporothrix schenckii TaxID=29908 RepID=U7PH78_SPOS1|nr:microsomal epoxide hydrolase [Sporothrix schenckii 1099-18]ERS94913.1 hypothetical protein HMPREF1624_08624 [Sporothrix schenckii ATCC 58251]KJR83995.1 microsomal epoxide hydrolase [Sporothrix schenckii 1099-18]